MNKVLIVEDDATIARVYRGLIRMAAAEAAVATDGEQAIELLHAAPPDLVLLDLMLPKKNGVEVLKHIRGTPALKDIPVVVFSNACMGELMQEAIEAGATQCLVKAQTPPKQLMEVLKRLLKPAHSLPSATDFPPPALTASIPPPEVAPAPAEHFGQQPAQTPSAFPARPAGNSEALPMLVLAPGVPPAPAPRFSEPLASAPDDARKNEAAFAATAPIAALPSSGSREELLSHASAMLSGWRTQLQGLAKNEGEEDRRRHLGDLRQAMHEMSSAARQAELTALAQVATATEVLLKELHGNIAKMNPSSLRTAAQALDCLDTLLVAASAGKKESSKIPLIAVLDDEAICRKLLASSLERAGLRALKLDDPLIGLKVLQENNVQLVFLDVMMPGMDGFELCKKLRASDSNKHTPIVFVTALSDLDTRALSILSGGNDFIGKPFLPSELIVKALVHLLTPKARATPPAGSAVLPSRPAPAPSGVAASPLRMAHL